jgi:23S rRNA (uracil1939-C5)-methyltransferase
LRAIEVFARDLFQRPLRPDELAAFDGVLFDPPRAGALAQARALADSTVPVVVAISCNVESFARDARLLVDGGYALESVTPLDQFRYSPHVEVAAVFRRPRARKGRTGVFG